MAYKKGQLNNLPVDPFTYKEVGIHYATLNAAAKRGLLTKNSREKTYQATPKLAAFLKIEALDGDFVSLKRPDEELGMLCEVKGMDILNCWGEPWDYDENILVWEDNNWVSL